VVLDIRKDNVKHVIATYATHVMTQNLDIVIGTLVVVMGEHVECVVFLGLRLTNVITAI